MGLLLKKRAESIQELDTLMMNLYGEITENTLLMKMYEIAPIIRRPVEVDLNASYPELGIRCFGKGTFHKPALSGIEVGTKKLFQIKEGDIIFSNVFAWEGGIGIAQKEDNNRYGSHRFICCVPVHDIIKTSFLWFHFFTPTGSEQIQQASPGGAGRNRTLGLKKLEQIEVPIPKKEHQEKFDKVFQKIQRIKKEMNKLNEPYEQLIPAIIEYNLKPQ